MGDILDLWDYRRRVSEMYRKVREAGGGEAAWAEWRRERDQLFRTHPQSALSPNRRAAHLELPFFPYDPTWRVVAEVEALTEESTVLPESGAGVTPFRRFAQVALENAGRAVTLTLFWLDTYGGGVFLPFRDLTNGDTTYGGGRYLLDTAKGADLGHQGSSLVLDFNFAYHPSCAYDHRWSCPLPPPRQPPAVGDGSRGAD